MPIKHNSDLLIFWRKIKIDSNKLCRATQSATSKIPNLYLDAKPFTSFATAYTFACYFCECPEKYFPRTCTLNKRPLYIPSLFLKYFISKMICRLLTCPIIHVV